MIGYVSKEEKDLRRVLRKKIHFRNETMMRVKRKEEVSSIRE